MIGAIFQKFIRQMLGGTIFQPTKLFIHHPTKYIFGALLDSEMVQILREKK